MKFSETPLRDAWVVEPTELQDARGMFARTFCAREFEKRGIKPTLLQANLSFNHKKGTLRGMHYQIHPAAETKLVRCTAGSIYDVIVDLRPDSPTYLKHFGVVLSAQNRKALYVPELFAHGYLTLSDDAEVTYQVGAYYAPDYERGLRYDDPALGIEWPESIAVLSEKDARWAPLVVKEGLSCSS